jgi:hypothetical protein
MHKKNPDEFSARKQLVKRGPSFCIHASGVTFTGTSVMVSLPKISILFMATALQPARDSAKEKEQAANQVKLDHAPTYVLADGSRVKALSVIDAGETVVIKSLFQ